MRRAHWIRTLGLAALVLMAGGSSRAGEDGTGGTGGEEEARPSLVTSFLEGELKLIDFEPGQPTLSVPVGLMPMDVEIVPGSTPSVAHAWVPNADRQLVEVVLDRSGTTNSLAAGSAIDFSNAPIEGIAPISVPFVDELYFPTDLALTADGRAFVAGLTGVVEVPLSGAGTSSIWLDLGFPARGASLKNLRGIAPVAACAAPGGDIFIANLLSQNVSRLGPTGFSEPVPLGDAVPIDAVCDQERVYVPSLTTGELFVIDQTTGALVTTISNIGPGPICATFDPRTQHVYVANFLGGDVVAIDTVTLMVSDRFRTTNLPTLMDVLGVTADEVGERWGRYVEKRIDRRGAPQAQLQRLFGRHRPGGLEQLLDDLLTGFLASEGVDAGAMIDVGGRAIAARDGKVHVTNSRLDFLSLLDVGTRPAPPPAVIPVSGGPNAVAVP